MLCIAFRGWIVVKAVWNGAVIAQSDLTVVVERIDMPVERGEHPITHYP